MLITGPRQAGKSTLLQHCLTGHTYLTLDDPGIRSLAADDPDLFLSTYPTPMIIDEIQYAPQLLPYIKMRVDQTGSLLNLSEIAKECGITQPTAKSWVSILESTYIIYLLKPYYKNHTKRLVKTPKLYFVDSGLLCYFLGIDTPERLIASPQRGAIFENMVIIDRLKNSAYTDSAEELFFYRTQKRAEIDLLIESHNQLSAYEIKFTKSPTKKMASTLGAFGVNNPETKLALLCLRHDTLPLTQNISASHWRD